MPKYLIFIILTIYGCSNSYILSTIKPSLVDDNTNLVNNLFKSCSGSGKIIIKGAMSGESKFNFFMQNDSIFFQFKDIIGRKILLLGLSDSEIKAWNILENKFYDNITLSHISPLINLFEVKDLNAFLWGLEPVINLDKNNHTISEKDMFYVHFKYQNERLLTNLSSIFIGNKKSNESLEIIIKERNQRKEKIDLFKFWSLLNV